MSAWDDVPDGRPPAWIQRFRGERMDLDGAGPSTVVKEIGVDGAYIASSVDAADMVESFA